MTNTDMEMMTDNKIMAVAARLCAFLTFLLTAVGCGGGDGEDARQEAAVDTLAVLVSRVQECSRLYTTEFRVHKIVACESDRVVGALGLQVGASTFGERKVLIPMEATLKGYVDLSGFSAANVERQGRRITITLPDPQVMMTATRIDHEGVRRYVTGLRDSFLDKELAALEAQGRKSIINEIPSLGIERAARVSAARMLIPIIAKLGYDEADITISFRDDLKPYDLKRSLR